MGLEEVKKELLENARKEYDLIIDKANLEAKSLIDDAQKKTKELESISKEELRNIKINLKIKETASSHLEAKRQILDVKKQLLDKVFSEVRLRLDRLGKKERELALKKLQNKVSREIEIGTIYCNSKDKELINFKNVKEKSILGGIIAEDSSGFITIDYTFETLLEGVYDQCLSDISNVIFSEK